MAEVFISYSQKDRALVAPIAARLEELGVDAWYDREISAGERFGAIIRARLKEAKAVLACWSPEAIQSDWVEAEADYARELGTYVPVFVTPCALMPPFNRIHADDLSKWTGEANDPTWIKLVDRIAKVIGREGVAAAARAFATGDDQTLYDFAKRYPNEPTARKIWGVAEARHREHFASRMTEAKRAAEERINTERVALDARLRDAGSPSKCG
jgi:TIR domain